ncbi:hypothetical protein AVEN_253858-1 [Araneus ventricosus]|uniref:Uncharacterized protein n=1 Tax=Araneus ventricosus TaxID=182803 RepID=A0A4Y2NAR9_ARAVE|nr:hypothetical protein AVEN_253858-1 [Araneus ventricosus]
MRRSAGVIQKFGEELPGSKLWDFEPETIRHRSRNPIPLNIRYLVRAAKDSRHGTFGAAHSLADRGRSADVQPFSVFLQNQFTLVLFRAVVVFIRAVAVFLRAGGSSVSLQGQEPKRPNGPRAPQKHPFLSRSGKPI